MVYWSIGKEIEILIFRLSVLQHSSNPVLQQLISLDGDTTVRH
jgi:hypothetical protein